MTTQDELHDALARAERAEAAYEALRYAISHDLSAPARHVGSFAELLDKRARERLDGRDLELLDHLGNAARRLEAMLEGMMRHGRLLARPLEPRDVDVDALVTTAVRSRNIGDGFDSMPADTRVRIDTEGGTFRSDPLLLQMILHELLANAVGFGTPHEPNDVSVRVHRAGGDLVIEVADTGTGVEHEHLERAVRLFGRLVTESEHPGIGLGLTLAAEAVRRLGGTLEHHDVEPHGARFVVRIPASEAASEASSAHASMGASMPER